MLKSILNIISPQICLSCHSLGAEICPTCKSDLSAIAVDFPLCFVCENLCSAGETHKACTSQTHLQKFLSSYKYEKLAKKILQTKGKNPKLLKYLLETEPTYAALKALSNYDLVVPMPPSPKYLNPRITEPIEIIANFISKEIKRPTYKALSKSWNAKQQKRQSLNRRGNPQLLLNPSAINIIKNRKILIFDDVCTTGATLNMAARLLLQNGAKSVSAYALVRDLRYNRA